METKFTQGKWSIHVHPEVNSIIGVDFGRFDDGVGFSGCEVTLYNQDNNANAHLIAAAPAMYELLQEVLHRLPSREACTMEDIRELLAIARGEK